MFKILEVLLEVLVEEFLLVEQILFSFRKFQCQDFLEEVPGKLLKPPLWVNYRMVGIQVAYKYYNLITLVKF